MRDDRERTLRSFDAVWRRVTESRGKPAPRRPEGLMPKKNRNGCCRQRFCPRG